MKVSKLRRFIKPSIKIDKQDIMNDKSFDGRGARPVANSKVIIFLNQSLKSDYLYDDKIPSV